MTLSQTNMSICDILLGLMYATVGTIWFTWCIGAHHHSDLSVKVIYYLIDHGTIVRPC